MSDSAEAILNRARETLRQAELAAADLDHPDARRRLPALRNVIVWGRAVTNVLQNLRGKASRFDEWYGPRQEQMRADPLLRFLYLQRSEILKTGRDPALSRSTYITEFSPADIPPAPPNAAAFFIGDQVGGSGWEVELPDGSIDKVYVELPESVARSWFELVDVPDEHLGQPVTDKSAQAIARLYLDYLGGLLSEAEQLFGGEAADS